MASQANTGDGAGGYALASIPTCTLVCKHPSTHIYLIEKHAKTHSETVGEPFFFLSPPLSPCLPFWGGSVGKCLLPKHVELSLDLQSTCKKKSKYGGTCLEFIGQTM